MSEIIICADSCCDINAEINEVLNIVTVPLLLNIDGHEISCNENISTKKILTLIKNSKGKILSSFPPPDSFAKVFEDKKVKYCITLSKNLSGSYSSAILGKNIANRKDITVIDSKSASAGELLTAIMLRKYINNSNSKSEINNAITNFVNSMTTCFCFESTEILQGNGRLEHTALGSVPKLGIKPVYTSDGFGKIKFAGFSRGNHHMINRFIDILVKSGKSTTNSVAVITHCNAEITALELKSRLEHSFNFEDIVICPTNAASTMYAQNGGIIFAF